MYVHCTDIARTPMMLVAQPTVQARHLCYRCAEPMQVRRIQPHVVQYLARVHPSRTFVGVLLRMYVLMLKAPAQQACVGLSREHGAHGIGEYPNPSFCTILDVGRYVTMVCSLMLLRSQMSYISPIDNSRALSFMITRILFLGSFSSATGWV